MSFVEAVRAGFRQYAVFRGRASRAEFWWWNAFTGPVWVMSMGASWVPPIPGASALPAVLSLVNLAVLLPGLAVAVRRLHDTSRSGWWLLRMYLIWFGSTLVLGLLGAVVIGMAVAVPPDGGQGVGILAAVLSMLLTVPVVAGYYVYVMTRPSQPGMNAYGPQPGVGSVEVA
jgi:uncharacterized membrane protein YhaH (DUF805 family)